MPEAKRIAFITYAAQPAITADDLFLATALRSRGYDVEGIPWGESDMSAFDAVVIRSPWDYHLNPDTFTKWLDGIAVPCFNAPAVMKWNIHKSYLLELEKRGVAIPPTELVRVDQRRVLAQVMAERGWDKVVVKPAISATAHNTWVANRNTAGLQSGRFKEQLRSTDLLVQGFVDEITTEGELSLMYFGGKFSHAVIKRAKPGDYRVQNNFGGTTISVEPETSVIAEGQRILGKVRGRVLYARVDGVMIDGRFHLMELELIEPVLFFGMHNNAAETFASCLDEALEHPLVESIEIERK